MNSDNIRESFIKYFVSNNHTLKESSSLIPNDPTLLLTAAGMVQFKDYFLGNEETHEKRLTSIQKCVRTSDIDIIGDTTRWMINRYKFKTFLNKFFSNLFFFFLGQTNMNFLKSIIK